MSQKHAVIYVPGLGDSRVAGQRLAVKAWRRRDIEPQLFQMDWSDGEAFAPKLERLLALIDRLAGEGKTVSLVGASAGGSAVINAFAERRAALHGIVCICGKISNKSNIHPVTFQRNPAFEQSMDMLPASLAKLTDTHRQRILSLHPVADETVPVADTKLPGVTSTCMPIIGHATGIGYGITIGSFGILRFLRHLPK